MNKYDFDCGVIGGGAAGLTFASGAAQLGAKTLLIEKEGSLGGDCLHYGCVPSKTLIKCAKVYHLMKSGPAFGLPRAEVPAVDFRQVSARIKSVIERIQQYDSEERFCTLGVKVLFGPAAFLDEHTVEVDGQRFTAPKWLLATGSSASVPPVEGLRATPYITNKEIFSLDRLPESMICIGAGPVAIEMAQAFQRLGCRVSVVERFGQILFNEDKDLADMVLDRLKAEGVNVHLNCNVKRVRQAGGQKEVVYENVDGREVTLAAQELLVAAGREPNIEGLKLESAGVILDGRGVGVDLRMRTSQPHIFAAGDVTGKYQFTHAAGYEGGVALTNAVLRLPRKADYAFLPWVTYTDPELASIGMNEKAAQKAGVTYKVITEEFKNNDRSLAEGYDLGVLKMLVDEHEKIIGVQILGPSAGDLLGEWAAVLNGGVKLSALASAVHPYPTLVEINKRAASSLLAPKLFSGAVPKVLKTIFRLKGRACGQETDCRSRDGA